MATIRELEIALVNADAAGDIESARVLANALVKARASGTPQGTPIPTAPTQEQIAAGAVAPVAPPAVRPISTKPLSAGEKFIGGVEAAGTVLTAPFGALGGLGAGGAVLAASLLDGSFGTKQAADAVEAAVTEGAASMTYLPRTDAGQRAVETIGEIAGSLPPVMGVTGTLMNASSLAGPAAAQATAAGVAATRRVGEALPAAVAPLVAGAGRLADRLRPGAAATGPQGQTGGSAGAQAMTPWQVRKALADELGIPLMKGQVTRTFEDQQELHTLSRDPKHGGPIRERLADQRQAMVQKFDEFIDDTGAMTRDPTGAAEAVDSALRAAAANKKQQIRSLYMAADKKGEMESSVELSTVANFLTEHRPEAEIVNVLKFARSKGVALGVFKEADNGGLVAQPVTLKTAELFRRAINRVTNDADRTDIRFSAVLKQIYDGETEGMGGDLYKKARNARREFAVDFENHELTRQLLGTKRGTVDRAVAIEDVVRKMVVSPSTSLDSLKQTSRVLKKSPDGQQAWRELQGSTIQYLQEKAIRYEVRDERNTPTFNARAFHRELSALDKSGKLEYIFGKRNSERLRTLDDVAQNVFIAAPGTVNTSGTAYTLAAMFDMMSFGAMGIPVPVTMMTKFAKDSIKDRKLAARVREQFTTNYADPKQGK